ncbi:hypothetical protein F5X97DRAFT_305576 [Nemania serpens]|nr:hypothetical protein F5X97DRAFT_305576 [Nemania serpens]
MAHRNLVQTPDSNTPHIQSHSHGQADEEIYDLDDLQLVPRLLSQGPKAQDTITCRFLAIPLNESDLFSRDIAQYGDIVRETKDELIIRVPPNRLDLLDRIRQLWVSKYLAPFTECQITFDLPKRTPDRTTTVIVQRVLQKTGEGTDSVESADSRPVRDDPDDGDTASLAQEAAAAPRMTNTWVRTT